MKYEFPLPPLETVRLWDAQGRPWVRDPDPRRDGWSEHGGYWVLEHAADNAPDGANPRADVPLLFTAAVVYFGPFTDEVTPCGWWVDVRHDDHRETAESREVRCCLNRGHRGAHQLPDEVWHQ